MFAINKGTETKSEKGQNQDEGVGRLGVESLSVLGQTILYTHPIFESPL
jgi:hypothetical protein